MVAESPFSLYFDIHTVMKTNHISSIVTQCGEIERRAAALYTVFADKARMPDLAEFWNTMAAQEREHLTFWDRLADLADKGLIPDIFQNAGDVVDKINTILSHTESLLKDEHDTPETSRAFLLAFRMEFHMLHPAFARIFHFITIFDKEANPADHYDAHLKFFLKGVRTFGKPSPEMELLGELLPRMWRDNRLLADQNTFDQLTRTLNRRGFLNVVRPLSYLAMRNKYRVGVLFVDIDHFKRLNDTHGHLAGDEALKDTAEALARTVRTSDVVGRFGGDEFVVFLNDIDHATAHQVAVNITCAVAAAADTAHPFTLSIGIAVGELAMPVEEAFSGLLEKADQALYRAKHDGRNRICCPDEE